MVIHAQEDWLVLEPGDPVLGFCNGEFLDAILRIRERTRRTVFVNCVTWLFDKEKELMEQGLLPCSFLRAVSDVEKTALSEYLRHEPERSSKFDYGM